MNRFDRIAISLLLALLLGGATLVIAQAAQPATVTGVGIAKEDLARLFEPLPLGREKGRDAGLSVSYGMVRRLGGDLAAESEPGKGTKFFLSLPVQGSVSPVERGASGGAQERRAAPSASCAAPSGVPIRPLTTGPASPAW